MGSLARPWVQEDENGGEWEWQRRESMEAKRAAAGKAPLGAAGDRSSRSRSRSKSKSVERDLTVPDRGDRGDHGGSGAVGAAAAAAAAAWV